MRKIYFIAVAAFLLFNGSVSAQDAEGWTMPNAQHDGLNDFPGNPTVQNGNGSLGSIFDTTLCGLNYVQSTVKLGQRSPVAGTPQPATFTIFGMASCSPVVRSYLWCVAAGTGIPITATITNPDGITSSFNMSVVGSGMDMCWQFSGTYVYRADVTSIISGNGNYVISGLPTSTTVSTSANDVDGATLFIMYQDLTASYTGSIHINDGAVVVNGGTAALNMTGFNACDTSSYAKGFTVVADLQGLGSTHSVNGNTPTTVTEDWMNFIEQTTTINQSQAGCNFNIASSGDCYTWAVAGLYTRTSCMTCNPSTVGLTVTSTSITPATCGNNGAATVSVSGGSGNYLITWSTTPTQYGTSATNLAGGNYIVTALDTVSSMCGVLMVTVPNLGPAATASSTPANCSANGTATVSASGGTPPYSYLWSPSGGTGTTASNLASGNYTVTVTDQNGCSVNATTVVGNTSTLSVSVLTSPDSCPSPSGWAGASVTGGQMPYSYLWLPGNQTTSSISNMTAGTYTVQVTDNLGCMINTVVTIASYNNGTQVNIASIPPVIYCGGGFMLYAAVNTTPATYSWQPTTYLSNPNIAAPMCIPFSSITYTVTVTSQCGTDTDTVTVTPSGVNLMDEDICVVTVDTAINRNVIVWEHTASPTWAHYNIYRETVSAGVYALIATQPASVFTTYTDMTSNPMNSAERYRISYVDSCGFESDTSAHHRTLFLQVGPAVPTGYNLLWTPYEGLNIATYNIYRGPNTGNMSLIAQVPGTTFNYSDPNPPMGTILYLVEAVHPSGCSPSMRLSGPNAQSVSYGSLSNLQVAFVGVDEINPLQNSLSVSPNPGSGIFSVNCNVVSGADVTVTITDAIGRVVYASTEQNQSSTFHSEIDLSSLAAGMYNVKVTSGTSEGVTKLVIMQ